MQKEALVTACYGMDKCDAKPLTEALYGPDLLANAESVVDSEALLAVNTQQADARLVAVDSYHMTPWLKMPLPRERQWVLKWIKNTEELVRTNEYLLPVLKRFGSLELFLGIQDGLGRNITEPLTVSLTIESSTGKAILVGDSSAATNNSRADFVQVRLDAQPGVVVLNATVLEDSNPRTLLLHQPVRDCAWGEA